MNGKYAVSGAQEVPVFSQTLEKAYGKFKQAIDVIESPACGTNGNC